MAVSRRFARFLNRHRVVAVDTNVFIYHLQQHPRYLPVTRDLLGAWERGSHRGVTSVVSLSEVLVKPLRESDHAAAEEYRNLLATFPNLGLLGVTRNIAEGAARIRAIHGLDLPDAIHIATAVTGGATGFISNDPAFRRVRDIEVLLLDEAVAVRR